MSDRNIVVNLDVPLARLRQGLQRVVDLVTFGLNATTKAQLSPMALPDVFFHVSPSADTAMGFDKAKSEFPAWVLACGFRDAVEALSGYLEQTRTACAALAWGRAPVDVTAFKAAVDYTGSAAKKFRDRNFKSKLDALK